MQRKREDQNPHAKRVKERQRRYTIDEEDEKEEEVDEEKDMSVQEIAELQRSQLKHGGEEGLHDGNTNTLERTFLSDEMVDLISLNCFAEQCKLVAQYRAEQNGEEPPNFAPDANMVKMYEFMTMDKARKTDSRFFGKGEFFGDEQKEKTQELLKKEKSQLLGLDDPMDPGWDPPVFYKNYLDTPKAPIYIYEAERKKIGSGGGGGGGGGNKEKQSTALQKKEPGEIKQFRIYPLTWDQFGTDWTIVLFGKRRSGKTVFIKSLCGNYLRPHFPRVYVFTKSYYSGEYSKWVPYSHIFPGLTQPIAQDPNSKNGVVTGLDVLRKILDTQKLYRKYTLEGKWQGNMNALIIFDDVLSDGLKYKDLVDELFFEGRHMNLCFIVTTQDFKGVNPACTGNTDCAITFRSRSERDKEAVRTKFADYFKNDEEYEGLTNQALKRKWHCCAYFQDSPHIDPEFTVFCGRPSEPKPFVMGAYSWWMNNMKQLQAIVNEEPELSYLLETTDWGVIGEEQFNEEMKHVPLAKN